MRFENKVVIVTGASSGIGRASAKMFAMEGAKVVAAAPSVNEIPPAADVDAPLAASAHKE